MTSKPAQAEIVKPSTWKTADGRIVRMIDMSDAEIAAAMEVLISLAKSEGWKLSMTSTFNALRDEQMRRKGLISKCAGREPIR